MNRKTKAIAAMLVLSSMISVTSFTAGAVARDEYGESGAVYETRAVRSTEPITFERYELSVSKVYNKSIWAYSSLSLTHTNGSTQKKLSSDARMINGAPYVSVRSFIGELAGMTVTYNSAARTLNVKGSGFEMDIIDGSNVIYANGRTLFSMSPSVIMTNGRMYAPISTLAKALGIEFSYTGGTAYLKGSVSPIKTGSQFYDADAVYWLSRIISAESRGESLLGQIAVGSVVMNRVRSSQYPNTIWGVIFDRKYGVQFSPILDGSIYNAPVSSAVVAAKICLEGFNVNREALFFLYPRASTSSWIPNNREYLFSIGKHDFYA